MNRIAILLFLLFNNPLWAKQLVANQDSLPILTLENAIEASIAANHEIIISRKEAEKASNNNFIGNADLLPSLNANGGYTRQLTNTNIEFASPQQEPINRENARSTALNGSLKIDYTIFDGLSRFYRLNSLQLLADLSGEEIRMAVENTIFAVLQRYFDIARLTGQLKIAQEAATITSERLERAKSKYELGAMDMLQVLNAKVDLNTDSLNVARTLQELSNAKLSLKVLMGEEPNDQFSVITSFLIDGALDKEIIIDKALSNNTNLILARMNSENSDLQQKIAQAGLYPELNANFGYEYNEQSTEAGFLTAQQNYGWTGGIQLSIPIFNGKKQRILIQNAKIDLEISKERLEQAKLQVRRDVLVAFENYNSILFQLRLSADNLETAELSLERSEEKWQLGQLSDTELRTAQVNLIRTANEINNLKIQAKLAEMQLLKLAGVLEQEVQ